MKESVVVSIKNAGSLGSLSASKCLRRRPDLGDELPLQVARAHVQTPSEPIDALSVDDAVRNQTHRVSDEIGPYIPFR